MEPSAAKRPAVVEGQENVSACLAVGSARASAEWPDLTRPVALADALPFRVG